MQKESYFCTISMFWTSGNFNNISIKASLNFYRIEEIKNIIIRDNEVGNLYLTLGAHSLNTIIYSGTLKGKNSTIEDILPSILQTYRNESYENSDYDTKIGVEIDEILPMYNNKSFTNNTMKHNNDDNEILKYISVVHLENEVIQTNDSKPKSTAAKIVPKSMLLIVFWCLLIFVWDNILPILILANKKNFGSSIHFNSS